MIFQHSPMDVVYHTEHNDSHMNIRPFKSALTLFFFFTTLNVAVGGSEEGREY